MENALFGWVGENIATALEITNPTVAEVARAMWTYGIPLITTIALLLAYHWWYSRYGQGAIVARKLPAHATEAPFAKPFKDWNGLSTKLKELYSESSNAHLLFVGGKRPIVEHIRSAFDLARWETSFVSSAFDQYPQGGMGRYYSGIEVKGHNRILAEAVADALLRAGLADVYTTVEPPLKISRENPKWDRLQHRVTIMVGHDKD